LKVREVAFFGHPVASISRARKFYGEVLNLSEPSVIDPPTSPDGDDGFIEYEIGSQTLAVTTTWSQGRPPEVPSTGLVLEVEDFEDAVRHLQKCGIRFELGPFEGPICHIAVIKDPDGNSIGIHKRKSP
jgi:predicted enzyme related to lactoylglutathione lyase